MIQAFTLAKHSKVIYRPQPTGSYYAQTAIEAKQTPIDRLPQELRIAPTGAERIRLNADTMLLDRPVKGKHKFRTGLQPTLFKNWYVGNDFEYYRGEKKLSLILAHLVGGGTSIEIYYFHRYDLHNTFYRMQYANRAIPHLLNDKGSKAA